MEFFFFLLFIEFYEYFPGGTPLFSVSLNSPPLGGCSEDWVTELSYVSVDVSSVHELECKSGEIFLLDLLLCVERKESPLRLGAPAAQAVSSAYASEQPTNTFFRPGSVFCRLPSRECLSVLDHRFPVILQRSTYLPHRSPSTRTHTHPPPRNLHNFFLLTEHQSHHTVSNTIWDLRAVCNTTQF